MFLKNNGIDTPSKFYTQKFAQIMTFLKAFINDTPITVYTQNGEAIVVSCKTLLENHQMLDQNGLIVREIMLDLVKVIETHNILTSPFASNESHLNTTRNSIQLFLSQPLDARKMMMHQTIETNFGEKEAEKYLKD
jgi:hypothetical protein